MPPAKAEKVARGDNKRLLVEIGALVRSERAKRGMTRRALGVIDLPTMKKKLNLHYSLSLDLFGSEVSTNAANAFNASLKGRFQETKIEDDHRLESSTYPVLKLVDGAIKRVDEPALTALNMRLRDDYT